MKLSSHIKTIFIIILVAGLLGGLGNYFILNLKPDNHNIIRSIILGVIAAAVLPLFLRLVSSNILEHIADKINYQNYLNFMSLCLLAALFADVFLQGVYAKVFHEFTDKVEYIQEQVDESNQKADFAIVNIKEQAQIKGKVNVVVSKENLNKLVKANNFNAFETKVYSQIIRDKVVAPSELYKIGDKVKVDAALKKIQREKLIKEYDIGNKKMILPNLEASN